MTDEQVDLAADKIIEGLCQRHPEVAALYADGKPHPLTEAIDVLRVNGHPIKIGHIRVEGVKSEPFTGQFVASQTGRMRVDTENDSAMPVIVKDRNDKDLPVSLVWGER